jgi:hypothetical protein
VVRNPSTCDEFANGDTFLDTTVARYTGAAPALPAGWRVQACMPVALTIVADDYPGEVSWRLLQTSQSSGATSLLAQGYRSTSYASVCVNIGDTLTLEMRDSAGDGLCCGYGSGYYELRVGGVLMASGAEYGAVEQTSFTWQWRAPLASQASATLRGRVVVPARAPSATSSVLFTSYNDIGSSVGGVSVSFTSGC